MDFKNAGTRKGIGAIQLDIKPAGIPFDIICQSLEPARKGRMHILDRMEEEIAEIRKRGDGNSLRLATLEYTNDSRRRPLAVLRSERKKLERETGARISVGDGSVTIVAKNHSIMDKAQEKVCFLLGREIEVGRMYFLQLKSMVLLSNLMVGSKAFFAYRSSRRYPLTFRACLARNFRRNARAFQSKEFRCFHCHKTDRIEFQFCKFQRCLLLEKLEKNKT